MDHESGFPFQFPLHRVVTVHRQQQFKLWFQSKNLTRHHLVICPLALCSLYTFDVQSLALDPGVH